MKHVEERSLPGLDALAPFPGCDGGDPGTPANRSIWLFGLEPGYSVADEKREAPPDDRYSVKAQLQWPFNRNAFKLLAAIEEQPISSYKDFALKHRPFERGSKGYFKGNLFPYPSRTIRKWSEDNQRLSGFRYREEYLVWCDQYRVPMVRQWLEFYQPRLFIAVGLAHERLWRKVLWPKDENDQPLKQVSLPVGARSKRVLFGSFSGVPAVVLPHLSLGLHGHDAIKAAAEFIKKHVV